MTRSTTRSLPSTQTSSRRGGVTLIELLIAVAVVGIVLALVIPIVLSNRRVVQLDQARTGVNQTVRAINDLLAADARLAGERFGLGLGLSPIVIATDEDGNSQLTLRRNLEDALPVCEAVSGGQADIRVADWAASPAHAQCRVQGATVSDGSTEWPETLYAHRRQALEAGGVVTAFIYDPVNRLGDWFEMSVPAAVTPDSVRCEAGAGGGACSWNAAANYSPDSSEGLYSYIALIDEINYRVVDGVLERAQGAGGEVLRIASGVERFNVGVTYRDGSEAAEVGSDAAWQEIVSLDVDIGVSLQDGSETVHRELLTSLFPRNLLSR